MMKQGFENGFPRLDRRRTGGQIRTYMQLRGLSVEDVRKHLMLESPQSVYHWLEGKSLPSVDNLYALGLLLQVPVDCLLCGEQRRPDRCSSNGDASVRRLDFYLDMFETMGQNHETGLH